MPARPPIGPALAIAALALFSIWITWRAKTIEMGVASGGRPGGKPAKLVGKPAPAFDLQSLDGDKISLAAYHGKTLIATFWASWCGPCRLEMPVLVRFYKQEHKADSDFQILAISIDLKEEDARGAAKTLKLPFPVLLDPDNHTSDSYQVDAIPTLFV